MYKVQISSPIDVKANTLLSHVKLSNPSFPPHCTRHLSFVTIMPLSADVQTAMSLTINILALLFAGLQVIFSWQCLAAIRNAHRGDFDPTYTQPDYANIEAQLNYISRSDTLQRSVARAVCYGGELTRTELVSLTAMSFSLLRWLRESAILSTLTLSDWR
jgi:hypothetical protein